MRNRSDEKNLKEGDIKKISLKKREKKKMPDIYFSEELFLEDEYISRLENELLRYNEYSEDYEEHE